MNKKIIIIVAILIVIAICISFFMLLNNKEQNKEENNQSQYENQNDNTLNKSKVLVLYFSATGNTEKIAKYIKNATNSDIVEIIPKDEYTSEDLDYNKDCRANKEQNDENARPEIKNTINVKNYDTIFLGYPIWWGTNPKIILTLLDTYDLSGKTVIPFCTSGGSGIEKSESDLKDYNSNINWKSGKGFYSSTKESEVDNWISELNIN